LVYGTNFITILIFNLKANGIKTIIWLIFFIQSNIVFGQKKFTVSLDFPKEFDVTKLKIAYDNGKTQVALKTPDLINGKLNLSGSYYSIYAGLILQYPKTQNYNYRNSFFLSEKPGEIIFLKSDTLKSPFDNYTLVDVDDFVAEKKAMTQNNEIVVKELEDYVNSLGDKFSEVWNDSSPLHEDWERKNKILFEKNMDFISQNGGSYYSFWFFRRNLTYPHYISPDSVLHFFNKTFPLTFINSEEGKTITTLLNNKLNAKKGGVAPNFDCIDIKGNKIKLTDYRNKKSILLVFWATWCGPCIKEIPAIRGIKQRYSNRYLEIISVSVASPKELFYKTVKKEKMNWINIFNDTDIFNAYAAGKGVPQIYLIDPAGQIIYSTLSDDPNSKSYGLPTLEKYLNELKLNK